MSGPSDRTTATVPARAALAGNPSDGHGGAVVAVPVPEIAATATVRPSPQFAVVPDDRSAERVAATRDDTGTRQREDDPDPDDLLRLVDATVRAARRHAGMPDGVAARAEIEVTTTIPRSVGLAGSSAIVIAVLRALRSARPDDAWSHVLAHPDAEAVVALDAERTGLRIAAGLQDRLVQAHGRPVLMEFDAASVHPVLGLPCGRVTPLPDPPGRLVVASRPTSAETSGVVHRRLAARSEDVAPTMNALAATARRAATALLDGDLDGLAAAIDATFDLRATLYDLDPTHVEMVEVARREGAAANYTGSGGSIVALCADDAHAGALRRALGGVAGCVVIGAPPARPPESMPRGDDDDDGRSL